MRNHEPIVLQNFKGLWQRNSPENTPLDHFQDCSNVMAVGENWVTRNGVGLSQIVAVPLEDVKRIYNYATQTANTTLVLTYDGTTGKIYHVINSATVYLILTVTGMTDFAFASYAGYAYLSPFGTFTTGDLNIQKGLSGQFVYVYLGAGLPAVKAAGVAPVGALSIANGAAGNTDPGFKLFGVVFESNTGALSGIGAISSFTTVSTNSVSFGTVPTGGATVVKRHIVATKSITGYNGNTTGYIYYFIPNGTINDNVTLFLNNVSFFDADLLEDASHLLDNFAEIPAGAVLSIYHNRLVVGATFTDISAVWVSEAGEPEAISQIDGLLIVPPDGNPITNAQELRDILYVFKRSRTIGFIDNGDVPSSWELTVIDNALGTSVHGIATVLDSGSTSVDFLIVATYAGILLFSGKYVLPELTWKIQALWFIQDRNFYRKIQIINSPVTKQILCVIPDGRLLVGDYANGYDAKNIRWSTWNYQVFLNCIAIVNIDEIVLGADLVL